ncbi:hypothetical protein [Streptomyces sp. NBC_00063]|uniref:hypothetical protein n=1 Tax=Streptomyces sp. NBC_00063 TaxID=2975638 RepID=UPI003D7613F7
MLTVTAFAKAAWDASHVQVRAEDRRPGAAGLQGCRAAGLVVQVAGSATFLRLPKLLDALQALPADQDVRLELGEPRHLDQACATALEG